MFKALCCALVLLLAIAPAYGQFKKVTSYYDEFCKNATGGYAITRGPGCRDSLVGCSPEQNGLYINDECFDADPFNPNNLPAGTVYQYYYDSTNTTCTVGQGYVNVLVAPPMTCFSGYFSTITSFGTCMNNQVSLAIYANLSTCLANDNASIKQYNSGECGNATFDIKVLCGSSGPTGSTPGQSGPVAPSTPSQTPAKKASPAVHVVVSSMVLVPVLLMLA